MTEVSAFGQTFDLDPTGIAFLRDDSLWRLKNIYEPVLATQTLAECGVALDIGAGFGAFAIPLAATFPGWRIYCFEPDPISFAALVKNIASSGLPNLIPMPFAVGGGPEDVAADEDAVRDALRQLTHSAPDAVESLHKLLPLRPYSRHNIHLGFLQRGEAIADDFHVVRYPAIAARYLAELAPRFLKIVAPQAEETILGDMKACELDHIVGESWGHVPADLVYEQCGGLRQTELPKAGPPLVNLRRSQDLAGRLPQLDVVVAMYNARAFILDCVKGILEGAGSSVHVIVVDDGSTDDAGELVADFYRADPRVRVLRKPNGGCASARNYGRLNSRATHIAFVDADDIPGPELYSSLLDLARQTGAEIVQGGFELLFDDGEAGLRVEQSYEINDPIVKDAQRHDFGAKTCFLLPSEFLMKGQPTIWRRVYRRDFLDNRKIWFPEHIRAFDDQIFQLLTLQAVHNVPVLDGVGYGYRQHPGQDIRQGDERNFYSLEMFRLVLKRGIADGWGRFDAVLTSYINTVNWISSKIRPDLHAPFVKGAAELWVYARKILGTQVFEDLPLSMFHAVDFAEHVVALESRLVDFQGSYAWAYLDSFEMQVPMMKSVQVQA